MNPARLRVGLPYIAATWFFGGRFGLLAGVVIVAMWLFLGPFGRALWGLSVFFLFGGLVATIGQGLPSSPVVGPDFGTSHMVAHVLVGLALATAALAGLAELTEERRRQGGAEPTASEEIPELRKSAEPLPEGLPDK